MDGICGMITLTCFRFALLYSVRSRALAVATLVLVFAFVACLALAPALRDPYNLTLVGAAPDEIRLVAQVDSDEVYMSGRLNSGRIVAQVTSVLDEPVPDAVVCMTARLQKPATLSFLGSLQTPVINGSAWSHFADSITHVNVLASETCIVTDHIGFVTFENFALTGPPGTVQIELTVQSDLENFTPEIPSVTTTVRLTSAVASVSIGSLLEGPVILRQPLQETPALILSDKNGQPVEDATCLALGIPVETPDDQPWQKIQYLGGQVSTLSDQFGIVYWPDLVVLASNCDAMLLAAMCEGKVGALSQEPVLVLASPDAAPPTLSWAQDPPHTVMEGASIPLAVRVEYFSGQAAVYQSVIAQIVNENGLPYSHDGPGCVLCTDPSRVSKELVQPLSLPSNTSGIAHFDQLAFTPTGPAGEYQVRFGLANAEPLVWTVKVKSSVDTVEPVYSCSTPNTEASALWNGGYKSLYPPPMPFFERDVRCAGAGDLLLPPTASVIHTAKCSVGPDGPDQTIRRASTHHTVPMAQRSLQQFRTSQAKHTSHHTVPSGRSVNDRRGLWEHGLLEGSPVDISGLTHDECGELSAKPSAIFRDAYGSPVAGKSLVVSVSGFMNKAGNVSHEYTTGWPTIMEQHEVSGADGHFRYNSLRLSNGKSGLYELTFIAEDAKDEGCQPSSSALGQCFKLWVLLVNQPAGKGHGYCAYIDFAPDGPNQVLMAAIGYDGTFVLDQEISLLKLTAYGPLEIARVHTDESGVGSMRLPTLIGNTAALVRFSVANDTCWSRQLTLTHHTAIHRLAEEGSPPQAAWLTNGEDSAKSTVFGEETNAQHHTITRRILAPRNQHSSISATSLSTSTAGPSSADIDDGYDTGAAGRQTKSKSLPRTVARVTLDSKSQFSAASTVCVAGQPIAPITLEVYDESGQLVAHTPVTLQIALQKFPMYLSTTPWPALQTEAAQRYCLPGFTICPPDISAQLVPGLKSNASTSHDGTVTFKGLTVPAGTPGDWTIIPMVNGIYGPPVKLHCTGRAASITVVAGSVPAPFDIVNSRITSFVVNITDHEGRPVPGYRALMVDGREDATFALDGTIPAESFWVEGEGGVDGRFLQKPDPVPVPALSSESDDNGLAVFDSVRLAVSPLQADSHDVDLCVVLWVDGHTPVMSDHCYGLTVGSDDAQLYMLSDNEPQLVVAGVPFPEQPSFALVVGDDIVTDKVDWSARIIAAPDGIVFDRNDPAVTLYITKPVVVGTDGVAQFSGLQLRAYSRSGFPALPAEALVGEYVIAINGLGLDWWHLHVQLEATATDLMRIPARSSGANVLLAPLLVGQPGAQHVQVLARRSGQPLAGVEVELTLNESSRAFATLQHTAVRTDGNGLATLFPVFTALKAGYEGEIEVTARTTDHHLITSSMVVSVESAIDAVSIVGQPPSSVLPGQIIQLPVMVRFKPDVFSRVDVAVTLEGSDTARAEFIGLVGPDASNVYRVIAVLHEGSDGLNGAHVCLRVAVAGVSSDCSSTIWLMNTNNDSDLADWLEWKAMLVAAVVMLIPLFCANSTRHCICGVWSGALWTPLIAIYFLASLALQLEDGVIYEDPNFFAIALYTAGLLISVVATLLMWRVAITSGRLCPRRTFPERKLDQYHELVGRMLRRGSRIWRSTRVARDAVGYAEHSDPSSRVENGSPDADRTCDSAEASVPKSYRGQDRAAGIAAGSGPVSQYGAMYDEPAGWQYDKAVGQLVAGQSENDSKIALLRQAMFDASLSATQNLKLRFKYVGVGTVP